MKINIQTLKNAKHSLEVNENSTVLEVKQKIECELKLGDIDEQKLIHLGKILRDEQKLDEAKVKPNDSIVVMISKKKKKEETPAAAATENTTATSTPATTTTTSTSTAPTTTATTTQPTTATTQPTTATSTSTAPSTSSTTATAAASNLVMGDAQNETIANLMGLGYERDQVVLALRAAFNNPDRAADYLISGIPDNIRRQMQEPAAPAQQQSATASTTSPTQATRSASGGSTGTASTPASNTSTGSAAQQALAQLAALANQGQATQQQQQQQSAPAGGDLAGMIAGLQQSPEFAQFRQLIQSNPQMIPIILRQLAQTQPQLVQALQQNPALLMQLIGGGGGGGEAGAAAAAAAGGRRMIQISAEEKTQLDNLESLGFDRQRALEAWLICDRNYELAANYLLENQYEDLDAPAAPRSGGTGGGS